MFTVSRARLGTCSHLPSARTSPLRLLCHAGLSDAHSQLSFISSSFWRYFQQLQSSGWQFLVLALERHFAFLWAPYFGKSAFSCLIRPLHTTCHFLACCFRDRLFSLYCPIVWSHWCLLWLLCDKHLESVNLYPSTNLRCCAITSSTFLSRLLSLLSGSLSTHQTILYAIVTSVSFLFLLFTMGSFYCSVFKSAYPFLSS